MSEKLSKAGLQHAWGRIKNYVDTLLDTKQDVLTAGTYITIDSNNVIGVNLTKANLLSLLGYRETTLVMTATDGTTTTKTILVKQ